MLEADASRTISAEPLEPNLVHRSPLNCKVAGAATLRGLVMITK